MFTFLKNLFVKKTSDENQEEEDNEFCNCNRFYRLFYHDNMMRRKAVGLLMFSMGIISYPFALAWVVLAYATYFATRLLRIGNITKELIQDVTIIPLGIITIFPMCIAIGMGVYGPPLDDECSRCKKNIEERSRYYWK